MSKIMCDVCGTTYQDTAECCPICGCTRDEAAGMMNDEVMMEEMLTEPRGKGGRYGASKKREIFDFDEVNPGSAEQIPVTMPSYDSNDSYEEEEPKQNTFVIILLTALIALLLVGAGFLFIRFYLPGSTQEEKADVPPTIQTEATEATEPAESTEPQIPCLSLALVSGMATGDNALVTPGQKFLINVIASPENTTDPIIYTSGDESVATVSENGQVVAVGEGETVINISCGEVQIPCKIVCSFVKETAPVVEETQAPTEAETLPAVELKLMYEDRRLQVPYTWQLPLDCDLEPNQVEWRSENSDIASVDAEGNITANRNGNVSIYAKYGDQEVSCLIRCYY